MGLGQVSDPKRDQIPRLLFGGAPTPNYNARWPRRETAWTYPHDGVSHLYVETDRPGVLQVNRLIQVDVAGTAPSWILNFIQLKRMRNLKKMDRFFQEQRLSAQTFLSHRNLIPKSSRSRCFLCQSAFSVLQPKSQCQKCGQVMCRSCVKTWNLHISGFDTKVTFLRHRPQAQSAVESRREGPPVYFHRLNRRKLSPPPPIVLSPDNPEAPILLGSPDDDRLEEPHLKSFSLTDDTENTS
ncbi:unnamed protein product [Aphanomyces euteiches]